MRAFLEEHLRGINEWWEFMVDWEGGGIFVYDDPFACAVRFPSRALLMHVRQMYNYCVGQEHGHAASERIARHLYETLDPLFERTEDGVYLDTPSRRHHFYVSSYNNAYVVLALSRFARTFGERGAIERAIAVYRAMDQRFADGPMEERGCWTVFDEDEQRGRYKSDNAVMHRFEAALNLLRVMRSIAPAMAAEHENYLRGEMEAMAHLFATRIAQPEEGYTVEHFTDDYEKPPFNDDLKQSLGHAFEWIGFLLEAETRLGMKFDFLDEIGPPLLQNALKNGLAENGAFSNDYIVSRRAGPQLAEFWPQVEVPLHWLWAAQRWGSDAFPTERAERMVAFYRENFFQKECYGGGIMTEVSHNGVPVRSERGHNYKCDHHAVRFSEKALEYHLV